jgi:general secretion pathway protein G
MRRNGTREHWAFSLLELVIVIVIIGIIATIAVPRLSWALEEASESTLRGNLAALREAINRYAAEHYGAYPGLHKTDGNQKSDGNEEAFYAQLMQYSSVTGTVGTFDSSATPPRIFGPYLRKMPRLNVGKNADEKADEVKFKSEDPLTEDEGSHTGWVYNKKTGEIIANTKDSDSKGTPYTEY